MVLFRSHSRLSDLHLFFEGSGLLSQGTQNFPYVPEIVHALIFKTHAPSQERVRLWLATTPQTLLSLSESYVYFPPSKHAASCVQ